MNTEEKVIAAVQQLIKKEIPMTQETRLRDDLGMDSMNLVELTVLVHSLYGVDLGRKSAELKLIPETIGDLMTLVSAA